MAKKTLADILEKRIRDAIYGCPEFKNEDSEEAAFEAADEAMEAVKEAVEMRLGELKAENPQ